MSLESNKQVVKRVWDELVNGGRPEAMPALVSPEFLDHTPLPGMSSGVEGLQQRLMVLHGAFPDFHSEIEQLIAEGDKVVALITSTGTHQRDFCGAPPTGRRFTIQEIHIVRIVGGKMVEHWGIPDFFAMLEQLGLVAAPWQVATGA
jgi:predicted ester cyclase